jgi:hypothetical protein
MNETVLDELPLRHVEKALLKLSTSEPENPGITPDFISIENAKDVNWVAPIVKFTVQSDPISEVGVNGCQALDILKYVQFLFESLNESFPCRENALTITKIEEAIHWQDARIKNRIKRGVEGKNLN